MSDEDEARSLGRLWLPCAWPRCRDRPGGPRRRAWRRGGSEAGRDGPGREGDLVRARLRLELWLQALRLRLRLLQALPLVQALRLALRLRRLLPSLVLTADTGLPLSRPPVSLS